MPSHNTHQLRNQAPRASSSNRPAREQHQGTANCKLPWRRRCVSRRPSSRRTSAAPRATSLSAPSRAARICYLLPAASRHGTEGEKANGREEMTGETTAFSGQRENLEAKRYLRAVPGLEKSQKSGASDRTNCIMSASLASSTNVRTVGNSKIYGHVLTVGR